MLGEGSSKKLRHIFCNEVTEKVICVLKLGGHLDGEILVNLLKGHEDFLY